MDVDVFWFWLLGLVCISNYFFLIHFLRRARACVSHTKSKSTSTWHIAQSMITMGEWTNVFCLNGFGLHLNAIHFVRFDVITCDLLVCSRRATINCHNIATGSFVHLMKFICSIKSWLTFVFVRICFPLCLFVISLYFYWRSQKNRVKFDISQVTCYFVQCPCKKQQQWKWKYHAKSGRKEERWENKCKEKKP